MGFHAQRWDIIRLFTQIPELFNQKKSFMHLLAICFLELMFVTEYLFSNGKEKINNEEKEIDWKLVKFYKTIKRSHFPTLWKILNDEKRADEIKLLVAFSRILKKFNNKGGGKNRKILLFLLHQEGVPSSFLGEFSGVTQRRVTQTSQDVTPDDIDLFYQRFVLGKKKQMFSEEEKEVVQNSFKMSCPSNSYSKGKVDKKGNFVQNYRQICPDGILFQEYKSYVDNYNRLKKLKFDNETGKGRNKRFVPVPTRCYNVFLDWKIEYKVKKTCQGDIDYNCKYCFEHWCVGRDLKKLMTKLMIAKNMKESLEKSMTDDEEEGEKEEGLQSETKERMNELDDEIEKLRTERNLKRERLKELEKHKTLLEAQRARTVQIEKELTDKQLLIFFDFTKYNYLVHDLCFVVIWKRFIKKFLIIF